TYAFSEIITSDVLSSSLETDDPSETAEFLAPKIHKTEDGRLAAIIIKYNKPEEKEGVLASFESDLPDTQPEDSEVLQAGKIEDNVSRDHKNKLHNVKNIIALILGKTLSLFKSRLRRQSFKSNPKKMIFLIAAVVIAVTLIFSIFTAIKSQNNARITALFSQVFPQAQKKYDEGESLLDLNKNLAKDSFLTAQKILEENKSKFPDKSKEKEKLESLLRNVNSKLSSISSLDTATDNRSKLSVSIMNGSGETGAATKASDFLKGLGYNVVSVGNADREDYQNTKIQVKSNKSEFLSLLKNDLSKNYTIGETSSDLPESSPEDALVIIGK
ncbi:MAG: LytR C-terminal domain-containing protein, partial [Patescibacteria group bacterium]